MNNFDWREFLYSAKEILKRVEKLQQPGMSDEALCRTGISRAYYAVFNQAAPLVDSDSLNGGTHERVIIALNSSTNQIIRQIGKDLDKLRRMRIYADYHDKRYPQRGFSGNAIAELQLAINYAETINKKINLL